MQMLHCIYFDHIDLKLNLKFDIKITRLNTNSTKKQSSSYRPKFSSDLSDDHCSLFSCVHGKPGLQIPKMAPVINT